jgi:quinol monooxygenase YgiN
MSVKGEKYKSKAAMKKHEGSEGMKERMKEYGPKKAVKKAVVKKMGKKK